MNSFKSTLFHVLEVIVPITGALFIMRFFQLGSDQAAIVVGIAINALSKFARTSDKVPLHDFVNNPVGNDQP